MKSLLMLFAILEVSSISLKPYRQRQYNIIYEKAFVTYWDKTFFTDFYFKGFKYNHTSFACNFTAAIAQNFGNNIEISVKTSKFLSNEYRRFPIDFKVNGCFLYNKDIFGVGTVFKLAGVKSCPGPAGNFSLYNFLPDDTLLPPNIPNGRWLVEIKAQYVHGIVLAVGEIYGATEEILKWQH